MWGCSLPGRDPSLLFAAPPAAARPLAVSQLLRCGHGCFLWLELVAELRDGTLRLLFITSLEEQPLQGCRLAQATLTNRLLIKAVIFKKFHPCCIPGCLKAPMFHQPQRVLLPPRAASHWVTAGQYSSPKPLPSTKPFMQGEPLSVSLPPLASFEFHSLFSCSSYASHSAVPPHASTPTCPMWCSRHGVHFFFSLPTLQESL